MRMTTLLQAQWWEMRRNFMLLFAPILMLFMAGLWSLTARLEPTQMFPPMILIMCTFMVGWQMIAMSMAEEREKRVLEALLLTPVRPIELIASKVIFTSIVTVLTAIASIAVWGSLPEAFGLTLAGFTLSLLFALAGGLITGTLVRDMKNVGAVTPIWLAIVFTGFPLFEKTMPRLWAVMAYLPGRPLFSIMHAGWTGSGNWTVQDFIVISAYVAVMITITVRRLRQSAFGR